MNDIVAWTDRWRPLKSELLLEKTDHADIGQSRVLKRNKTSGCLMFEKGRMEHLNPLVSRARALKLELGCKVLLQERRRL